MAELTLTPDEAAHEARVLELVRARIAAAGGALPFVDFMALALYAPGLGYYSAGARKFGRGGDFTTAPELSPLFGRCLARQCRDVLAVTGGSILEFGAGTGALAATVLEALAQARALPERYLILEVSADLRARQQARIAQLPPALAMRVAWLDGLPVEPLAGVVLANEVLDALPCERFVVRGGQARRIGVGVDAHGALGEVELGATLELPAGVDATALPEGYRGELRPALAPWVAGVAASLGRGLVLACDYGDARSPLYHADRTDGTLLCHFRHRAHGDPLIHVGLQDITAWVDFTAVAEAAAEAGLEVAGFATQAALLLALGIERDVAGVADGHARIAHAAEARQLLLPTAMGESFKAIALTRGLDGALSGFSLQDLRRRL
ncbi:MAG: class I SAM-dependent methyltransferase [Steroidobacteraceae bacterium]